MMKANNNIEDVPMPIKVEEGYFKEVFKNCGDVKFETYTLGLKATDYIFIYTEGLIASDKINEIILPSLSKMQTNQDGNVQITHRLLQINPIEVKTAKDMTDVITKIFSGELILLTNEELYSINIANPPIRTPEESNTESSIRGPRDGFIEDITTNIALIRKRLKTKSLAVENFVLGTRSKTKVSLLYVSDVIDKSIVDEVKKRINNIEIDVVVSSSELEELLADRKLSLFPLIDYIGTADFAVTSLIRGRFIVIIDGVPNVLIGPTNLLHLLKSPDDAHSPFYIIAFQRLLRLVGITLAIFLPGFWLSVSVFNMDQIPFPLLATITVSRMGLPFSATIELLLMLGLFELFREAGIRLPKAVGQTVAVVGGLIIGESAIQAGITSPTMLVVTGVTVVSSFTLVNQSLNGTVVLLRFFVVILSAFLGMFGFIMALLFIVLYLSTIKSFGVPYLTPISPLVLEELTGAVLRLPWSKLRKRPESLRAVNTTRQGDDTP
ncbi:spore germination protein [Bacillus luteolus]|uniref:Spore germination protein n=1 Tax=Litchfieldia luteola TaxID=682179 RepID=A0ABR9QGF3_9BACI|nr:spore germination protein [Cytobacillus luteolus]MBE4907568.1 spore germination protein [Cytobacillus luteolus]MBP1944341.1 hypothetical protein [Cytobacillus luteolus]